MGFVAWLGIPSPSYDYKTLSFLLVMIFLKKFSLLYHLALIFVCGT